MLIKFTRSNFALIDQCGLPRYWAAAWTLLIGSSLAASTLKQRLTNIEAFYQSADAVRGPGALDDALAALDCALLEEMLEIYFVTLVNVTHVSATAENRWRDALSFVRDVCERLARSPAMSLKFHDIQHKLDRLSRLYGQLRTTRKSKPKMVRALPGATMQALYDAVIPGSITNPFQGTATQWRVYVAFLLLLHQGLRRGEALLLPADFLKSERTSLGTKYWLNVHTNQYEDDDPRHTTPSIKTASSIRTLPVSLRTAEALTVYTENYRGRQDHSFFLSSSNRRPLSAEGLHYFFKRLSAALPPEPMQVLYERTGMTSISAHDLRHTAAVVRIKQLLAHGDAMPEALQKLRSFFGWSPTSPMPQLYAKAAFEERLETVWTDEFDSRVSMLKELPQ